MNSDQAILTIRDAAKAFDGRAALAGADLSLSTGEIYALLGPNGAGKTTLIRAISGRVRLDRGKVRLRGSDPSVDADARRHLGLVPQDIALYPHLTVRENLEVLGALAGVNARDIPGAVERALDWTGLRARVSDRVEALSGGMKRRLNIAAGTLHNPQVLLLDEPTVGVDPVARDALHDVMRALRDQGMGILLTTHDLEQAEEVADRIGIMVDGRICAEGTFESLVQDSFGGDRELTVTLGGEPADAGRAVLRSHGLSSASQGRTWTGRSDRGLDSLPEFGEQMRQAGLDVTELRVREPGLRAVFFRITGREFDT